MEQEWKQAAGRNYSAAISNSIPFATSFVPSFAQRVLSPASSSPSSRRVAERRQRGELVAKGKSVYTTNIAGLVKRVANRVAHIRCHEYPTETGEEL